MSKPMNAEGVQQQSQGLSVLECPGRCIRQSRFAGCLLVYVHARVAPDLDPVWLRHRRFHATIQSNGSARRPTRRDRGTPARGKGMMNLAPPRRLQQQRYPPASIPLPQNSPASFRPNHPTSALRFPAAPPKKPRQPADSPIEKSCKPDNSNTIYMCTFLRSEEGQTSGLACSTENVSSDDSSLRSTASGLT